MPKRRQTRSPRYAVDISLKAQDIARLGAALTFKVKVGDGLLGTIQIGQGGFRWRGRQGKSFHRIRWERFFAQLENA